jgi:hypothetical protein
MVLYHYRHVLVGMRSRMDRSQWEWDDVGTNQVLAGLTCCIYSKHVPIYFIMVVLEKLIVSKANISLINMSVCTRLADQTLY